MVADTPLRPTRARGPNAEFLARTFIGALDIARNADFARKGWASALKRIDAILEVKRALERPAEDIAGDRMNRANMLKHLGRIGEAKAELEACLEVFRNYPARGSAVLSSLANLFKAQGDITQAITQERRALALCEQLPDPQARAISHNNLANYLERSGTPYALTEASRHRLTGFIYLLAAGIGQHAQTVLGNYAIVFRSAQAAGTQPVIPHVAELLADPAFAPLERWLRQREVNVADLQSVVGQLLEQARQAALKQDQKDGD